MIKIQSMLEVFKGLRSVASIKTRTKTVLITHMRNKSGNIEATRKGIANVFAFYNDLFSIKNNEIKDAQDSEAGLENTCDHPDDDIDDDEQDRHIPEFATKELMTAIDCLKKGNQRTAGESKQTESKELTKKQ